MRKLSCLLLLATLAACGGDDSSSPRSLPGTYTLRTADGRIVPAIVYEEPGYRFEILSGAIRLETNGSFSDTYTIRETDGANVTQETFDCDGTWTRSGNTVNLEEFESLDCGDFGTGTWDGNNSLTIQWALLDFTGVHRR